MLKNINSEVVWNQVAIWGASIVALALGYSYGKWQLGYFLYNFLVSYGIIIWSLLIGNGILWILLMMLFSIKFIAKTRFVYALCQVLLSFLLGLSMNKQWYLAALF